MKLYKVILPKHRLYQNTRRCVKKITSKNSTIFTIADIETFVAIPFIFQKNQSVIYDLEKQERLSFLYEKNRFGEERDFHIFTITPQNEENTTRFIRLDDMREHFIYNYKTVRSYIILTQREEIRECIPELGILL